jgi:hypothetical protein
VVLVPSVTNIVSSLGIDDLFVSFSSAFLKLPCFLGNGQHMSRLDMRIYSAIRNRRYDEQKKPAMMTTQEAWGYRIDVREERTGPIDFKGKKKDSQRM